MGILISSDSISETSSSFLGEISNFYIYNERDPTLGLSFFILNNDLNIIKCNNSFIKCLNSHIHFELLFQYNYF